MIDPDKLQLRINEQEVSVYDVAEAIESDPSTIYRWLSADRSHVSRDHLRRLCAFFKCEPVDLIDVDLKERPSTTE